MINMEFYYNEYISGMGVSISIGSSSASFPLNRKKPSREDIENCYNTLISLQNFGLMDENMAYSLLLEYAVKAN